MKIMKCSKCKVGRPRPDQRLCRKCHKLEMRRYRKLAYARALKIRKECGK